MSKRRRRKKTRKKQKGGGWTPELKKAIEIEDDVRQARSEAGAAAAEAAAMTTEIPALSMEEASAKVATANRLMKQPYASTLPGAGCMPLAMGGMPESPYPLPPIPCPRSGIPSWLEALGVAGPDPLAMIPMPPFVGGTIAAEDLRGDIEEKIGKFEASNKIAAKAKAMGIPIPPDVEGADWETKTATAEAYRLLKPGQILLDWDTEELDKKLANVGVKPSIPKPKPPPAPKPAAGPSMSGEEVSEAEIAKLNKGLGKKMVVFEKGFTWKGGGRKSRKKKHQRKKRKKTRRGGMPKKKKAKPWSISTQTPWKCDFRRPNGKLFHTMFFKTKEKRDAHHQKHNDRLNSRLARRNKYVNELAARGAALKEQEAALKAQLREAEEAAAAADAAAAEAAAANEDEDGGGGEGGSRRRHKRRARKKTRRKQRRRQLTGRGIFGNIVQTYKTWRRRYENRKKRAALREKRKREVRERLERELLEAPSNDFATTLSTPPSKSYSPPFSSSSDRSATPPLPLEVGPELHQGGKKRKKTRRKRRRKRRRSR